MSTQNLKADPPTNNCLRWSFAKNCKLTYCAIKSTFIIILFIYEIASDNYVSADDNL